MDDPTGKMTAGVGVAGFFLSINVLADRVRRDEITLEDARAIIARSREAAQRPGFPGDEAVMIYADRWLELAEQILAAATAQRPPEGPH